ncbi:sigma-54-dependent transcriptional regulator [Thermosulfuriphilus sp.]
MRVLVLSPEANFRDFVCQLLEGWGIEAFGGSREWRRPDLVITLEAKGQDLRFLDSIFESQGRVFVINFSHRPRAHHWEFKNIQPINLRRPFFPHQLLLTIERHLKIDLGVGHDRRLLAFVGRSSEIVDIKKFLPAAAKTDLPVFIEGAPGTGKTLLARFLHAYSHRQEGPFVVFDPRNLSPHLQAVALLGAVKGVFKGQRHRLPGRIKMAHQGTLLIENLEYLCPDLQKALLRILESGKFTPLGSRDSEPVDLRLITTSIWDREALISSGRIFPQLFFRLESLHFYLPPLERRSQDIGALTEYFLEIYAAFYNRPYQGLSGRADRALKQHRFGDNIRGLEEAIKSFVLGGEEALCRLIPEMAKMAEVAPKPLPEIEEEILSNVVPTVAATKAINQ